MNSLAASSSRGFPASFSGRPRNGQTVSKPPPVLDLAALQTASHVLQEQLAKDAQIVPDLGDMLTVRKSIVFHVLFCASDVFLFLHI